MLESRYLKDNIENIQKLLGIPALRNFETKSLQKLLRLSRIREYEDGEVIIKEGDLDPWLYILLNGKIRITKENMEINTIDKKGEIFGEMRVIDFMKRSASVVAVGKTVLCPMAVVLSRYRREVMNEAFPSCCRRKLPGTFRVGLVPPTGPSGFPTIFRVRRVPRNPNGK